jgi:hypothetical protein
VYCSERKLCADFVGTDDDDACDRRFPRLRCHRGALTYDYPKCSPGEILDLCLDQTMTASLMLLPSWRRRFGAIYTGLVVCCLCRSVVCRFVYCGGVCMVDGGGRRFVVY